MTLFSSHSSSSPMNQREKEIAKEEKDDDKAVKHVLKELSHAEKSRAKARKSEAKAENALRKACDQETSALKALNKAAHNHEIAIANLHGAESTAKLKERESLTAQREFETLKSKVDTALHEQQEHKVCRVNLNVPALTSSVNQQLREERLANFEREVTSQSETN
ncbi:hypothetical protein AMATHDRAFT_56412 [Amanita thiersii Skay4041]|uniref:Uncharacterized protein n=1 Tax=Amanita thiersii Skay4041 TaxID=703135 RepID=A0A2A9NWU9_9AGAR|nr:hypothetical protein AMATHDRAFT_56412 [Amanita thiersii Skay4041]